MRKLFDDVKISEQEIADIMANDIIKREIIDSEDSKKAKKEIDRIYKKLERAKEKSGSVSQGGDIASPEEEKPDILVTHIEPRGQAYTKKTRNKRG